MNNTDIWPELQARASARVRQFAEGKPGINPDRLYACDGMCSPQTRKLHCSPPLYEDQCAKLHAAYVQRADGKLVCDGVVVTATCVEASH